MDWNNRSREELEKNRAAAYTAAYAADAAYAAAAVESLNEYFEITGEDREEYEKALEEIGK